MCKRDPCEKFEENAGLVPIFWKLSHLDPRVIYWKKDNSTLHLFKFGRIYPCILLWKIDKNSLWFLVKLQNWSFNFITTKTENITPSLVQYPKAQLLYPLPKPKSGSKGQNI